MGKIGPGRTFSELQKSAQRTRGGKGRPQLPGVKTDAMQMRPEDYKVNRELGKRISEAMLALKGSSGGKPRFVIGWRLYPNADHKEYWADKMLDHVCSCACGCTCTIGPNQDE